MASSSPALRPPLSSYNSAPSSLPLKINLVHGVGWVQQVNWIVSNTLRYNYLLIVEGLLLKCIKLEHFILLHAHRQFKYEACYRATTAQFILKWILYLLLAYLNCIIKFNSAFHEDFLVFKFC